MRRLKSAFTMAVVAALAGLSAACGGNGDGQQAGGAPSQLKIATFQQGSSWYTYGATFSDLLRQELQGTTVQVLPFAGGVGNPELVIQGEADLALTFNSVAKWAYNGEVAYDQPMKDLRAVVGELDDYYVGIVARRGLDANSLEEIAQEKKGVRLYTLPPGSAGEQMTRVVLEANGMSYDKIKEWGGSVEHTSFDVIKSAFRDGRADLLIQVITANHPAVTEIATSNAVKFLPTSQDVAAEVKDLGLSYTELPANSFRGQSEAVPALGLSTVLLARKDLPDDLVAQIAETLTKNAEQLGKANKALADFDPKKGVTEEAVSIPLHPGAEQYYKKAGLLD